MDEEYKNLAVKIGIIESSITELKENDNQILNKLEKIEEHNRANEIEHEKLDFMVNTLWQRAGLDKNKPQPKPQESFNQGLNRVIAAVALWLASLVLSTVLVAYIQNKVVP